MRTAFIAATLFLLLFSGVASAVIAQEASDIPKILFDVELGSRDDNTNTQYLLVRAERDFVEVRQ